MKHSLYLDAKASEALELESISDELAFYLVRYLEKELPSLNDPNQDGYLSLTIKNKLIGISYRIKNRNPYTLQPDDFGDYGIQEQSWVNSEFSKIFTSLDASQFAELACELIENEYFDIDTINNALEQDDAAFRIKRDGNGQLTAFLTYDILPEDENDPINHTESLSTLWKRLEDAFYREDTGAVLSTSSNMFESVLNIVSSDKVSRRKTFDYFYKKRDRLGIELPDHIWEYMFDVYKKRNKTPLAGHGSKDVEQFNYSEMIELREQAHAIVKTILGIREHNKASVK